MSGLLLCSVQTHHGNMSVCLGSFSAFCPLHLMARGGVVVVVVENYLLGVKISE